MIVDQTLIQRLHGRKCVACTTIMIFGAQYRFSQFRRRINALLESTSFTHHHAGSTWILSTHDVHTFYIDEMQT